MFHHNYRFSFYVSMSDDDLEIYVHDDFGNLVAVSIDQQLGAHLYLFN